MSLVDAIKRYLCNVVSATSVRFFNVRTDGMLVPSTSATLAAAGTTQNTATPIVSQVTVVNAGQAARGLIQGVILPVPTLITPVIGTSSLILGSSWTVRNDIVTTSATNATNVINVYPPTGGLINNLAANSPWPIQPGDTVEFVLVGGSQALPNYITKGTPNPGPTQFVSFGNLGGVNQAVVTSDIGSLFSVAQQSSNVSIQLPPATQFPAGATLTFVQNATADGTHTFTILPDAADGILSSGIGGTSSISFFKAGSVGNSIGFSATATLGSTIILRCKSQVGANAWHATVIGGVAASACFA